MDPLEWQISQDTANTFAACMANTIGAAESVLRVAATGHDKRLFLKVTYFIYIIDTVIGYTLFFGSYWIFSPLLGLCSSV